MSSRSTKLPGIPSPTDSNLQDVARAVKGILDVREGLAGNPLDANVTFRDLADGGVISVASSGGRVTGVSSIGSSASGGSSAAEDLTPPPAPTGLTASAGIAVIILGWNAAGYSNHAYTEVWRSTTDVIGNAVFIGTTESSLYNDNLGVTGAQRYYWVRHRSTANIAGPYNATSGVSATTGKIGNVDLGPLIVEAANLASGAVSASKLAANAVDLTKFASGIEPLTIVTGALPTTKSTSTIFRTDDSKTYRWSGTAYVATISTSDLSGTISDAQIAGLAASKVTGALTDTQLTAISAAKVTGQIVGTQITDGAISTAKLAAGSVTASTIAADTITAAQIAAGAITASELAAGSVVAGKIQAGAIQAADIAAGSITGDRLTANTITASQIAANTITAGQIAAGAISASQIAAGAIRAQHILIAPKSLNLDPSFEGGSTVWTGFIQRLARSNGAVPASCPSPFASQFGNRDNPSNASIEVVPGEVYRASCYVNRGTGGGGAGIGIYGGVRGADGATVATFAWPSATTTAAGWVRVTGLYTIPANGATLVFGPWADRTAYTGEAWFADLNIEKVADASLIVDGAISATKLAANSIAVGTAAIQNGAIINAMLGNAIIDTAKIADAAIVTAKIGDAQITNAKIGGTIQSDNYSAGSAGWSINKTSGFAEFGAASIRGQLTASQINSNGLTIKDNSGNILLGVGSPLAASNITPDQGWLNSNIPSGSNLQYNSDFTNGLDGWTYAGGSGISQAGGGINLSTSWYLAPYSGPGTGVLWSRQDGRSGNVGHYYEYQGTPCTVVGGKRYAVSAYTGAHRCKVAVFSYVYDASNSLITNTYVGNVENNEEALGGAYLTSYKRTVGVLTMPSNAAYVKVVLRKYDTSAGNTDSYMFVGRVQVEQVEDSATTAGPWSPMGYVADNSIGITKLGTDIQTTNYSSTAGWRITKAGAAYFNQVSVRGEINGGAFTGWAWPPAGQTGFHLGPNGLLLGNANDNRYFYANVNGDVSAPGFSISAGSALFSGTLSANIVKTTNIEGAQVTSGYSASSTGLTASVTVTVPTGSSSMMVVAYIGDPTLEFTGGGKSGYSYTNVPSGTLYINGGATTTQKGTLIWTTGSPGAGTYTVSVTRDGASGTLNLGVLVTKR